MTDLSKLQKDIKKFRDNIGWNPADPTNMLLGVQEELGEVSGSYLGHHVTTYSKSSKVTPDKIEQEMGDLLFSYVSFANSMNLDLTKCLELTLQKITEAKK